MRKFVTVFFVVTLFSFAFFACSNKKNETSKISTAQTNANESAVTTALTVSGMTCGSCARIITNALRAVPGVTNVSVDLRTGVVTVTHEPKVTESEIRQVIVEAGYRVGGNR